MTTNEPPAGGDPPPEETEGVGRPVPDDAPPKRGPQPFVWLAVVGVVVLATAVLLLALAGGLL